MKLVAVIAVSAVLAGCGGGGASSSRNELAAAACDVYAKGQLGDKTYKLDHTALASSLTDSGDGSTYLHTAITIDPGLSSESKQTLECTVRFIAGKELPDVLKMQFIWE